MGWLRFLGIGIAGVDYETAKMVASESDVETKEEYLRAVEEGALKGLPLHPDVDFKDSGWESWDAFLA